MEERVERMFLPLQFCTPASATLSCRYSFPADIWALGMTLLEAATGEHRIALPIPSYTPCTYLPQPSVPTHFTPSPPAPAPASLSCSCSFPADIWAVGMTQLTGAMEANHSTPAPPSDLCPCSCIPVLQLLLPGRHLGIGHDAAGSSDGGAPLLAPVSV